MRRGGDANVLLAAGLAGAAVICLGSVSAWWLDSVLGARLRGTGWEFLLFPSIVLIVCGGAYAWWRIYRWIMEWLEPGHADDC